MRPSEFDPDGWACPDWSMGPDDFVVTMRRKQVVTRLRRHPPTELVMPAGAKPSAWLPEAQRALVAENRFELCWHFELWDPDYGPWEAAMEAAMEASREYRASPARYFDSGAPGPWDLRRRAEALHPDKGGRFGFTWQVTRATVAEWAESPHTISMWFDVDHVVPLMADGPHAMANLQLLCKKCHLDKSRRERKRKEAKKPRSRRLTKAEKMAALEATGWTRRGAKAASARMQWWMEPGTHRGHRLDAACRVQGIEI
jgi:HNH endonuclease